MHRFAPLRRGLGAVLIVLASLPAHLFAAPTLIERAQIQATRATSSLMLVRGRASRRRICSASKKTCGPSIRPYGRWPRTNPCACAIRRWSTSCAREWRSAPARKTCPGAIPRP